MGIFASVDGRAPIHLFASSKSWIEGSATAQLETVARLPGVAAVAGMPDLHPGKYGPVGCAVLANAVHPALIGSDIGCGMGLFQLDLMARRLRAEKAAERLRVLGTPWDGDAGSRLAEAGLASDPFDASLGSIGGGNHFAEVQAAESIVNSEAANRAGIDGDATFALVHSGSRGLGFSILERVMRGGLVAFDTGEPASQQYLADHDRAVAWARLNRQIVAERLARALGASVALINDLPHNLAEVTDRGILHRKGAAPADRGLVPIPGSRGTLTYLVEPLAADRRETLASLAHGAGRKRERGAMHGRAGQAKSDLVRLARNPFGGIVVCEDKDMLIEEAPEAYKAIERVMADLTEHGLARVVATFRPVVTFKSIKPEERRPQKGHRERGFVDKRQRGDWS